MQNVNYCVSFVQKTCAEVLGGVLEFWGLNAAENEHLVALLGISPSET